MSGELQIGRIRKRNRTNTYSCYCWYMHQMRNSEGKLIEMYVKREYFLHGDSIQQVQERIQEITDKIKQDE